MMCLRARTQRSTFQVQITLCNVVGLMSKEENFALSRALQMGFYCGIFICGRKDHLFENQILSKNVHVTKEKLSINMLD